MQALVSLATNASFGFSYTNFAKLRLQATPFHHELNKEKTTFTSGFLRASDENRTHVFSLEG